MKHGKSFIVTVTILTVFLTVVSIYFTDNSRVFAQSSLFGNDNGGLVGNMFRNFGSVVGNLGINNLNPPSTTTIPNTTPSTPSTTTIPNTSPSTPSVSSQPLTGLFGNTPTGTTNISPDDKNRILSSLFGIPAAAPAVAPAAAPHTDNDNNGQHIIDKPCHPGKCLGTPGWYTVEGHHHCYEGTRDCIHTSHFHDEHY
ncbi:MAG TPA: hypothetical protein VIY08_08565 [Candidatus Nitrosocosmicus sp.]